MRQTCRMTLNDSVLEPLTPGGEGGDKGAGEPPPTLAAPTLVGLFLGFARLGATSFGGPAMVAQIERFVTERRRWLTSEDMLSGVTLAQFIPGATAMQVAAFVGYRLRGGPGAAAAFLGFGIHAFLLMVALSASYQGIHRFPVGAAVFSSLQAVVAAIVVSVALSFGRRNLKSRTEMVVACFAAAAFLSGLSPITIVIVTAVASGMVLPNGPASAASMPRPKLREFRLPIALMLLGVIFAVLLQRLDHQLADLALVMAKVDLFAFGGAYGSLPLMLHEVVDVRHWLDAATFLDGIALGQITPGPIVITATFVGWAVAGLPGALVATVSVFFPSFVVLTAAMPVIELVHGHRLAGPIRRGTSAAVAGLIAATGIKLALALPLTLVSMGIGMASLAALLMGLAPLWVVAGGGLAAALVQAM